MADNEKHPIRNGIIATVAGGLILYFVPQLNNFVFQLFGLLITALANIWRYLWSSTILPNSIIGLLIILAIPTLIRTVQLFAKHTTKKPFSTNSEPKVEMYNHDKFFEIDWRWSHIINNFPTDDLWCFCPRCSTRLIYKYTDYLPEKTIFYCENCDFQSKPIIGDKESALSLIARQIERRVNTGEWKEIIKANNNVKKLSQ